MDTRSTKRPTDEIEQIGVNAVEAIFLNKVRWIFRRQYGSDFGIDAQVEPRNEEGKGSGKLVALQIKSGASHFIRRGNGYVFYGERRHLDYWDMHSLPVLLVLHNPTDGMTLWQHVERDLVVENANENGNWSIAISPSRTLTAESSCAILDIIQRYDKQHLPLSELMGKGSFTSEVYWLRRCQTGHMGPIGWPTSLAASVGLDRSSQITVCIGCSAHALHLELMRVEDVLNSLDEANRFPSRNWTRASGWFSKTKSDSAIIELTVSDFATLSRDTVEGVVQRHFELNGEAPAPALVIAVPHHAELLAYKVVNILRSISTLEGKILIDVLTSKIDKTFTSELREFDGEFISLINEFNSASLSRQLRPKFINNERFENLNRWLSGTISDKCYFSKLGIRDTRLILESGQLGFGASGLTHNAIRRSSALVESAANNHDLLFAIGSLPVERDIVQILINSPVHVRAVAGLIARKEMQAMPVEWFGKPIEAWRHGRILKFFGR